MRPEDLQVNLRPRSSWEAMELGAALLRRHLGAVWRPWLLAVLVLAAAWHSLAWVLGVPWLGVVLLWWSKPALEQVPLYVLSRAVFGQVPDTRASLRALPRFGWRWLPACLGWRRLGPARSLLAPVDLLEGNQGRQRRLRRQVLAGPAYLQAALLTGVCMLFELVVLSGAIALVFLFTPAEQVPELAQLFGDGIGAGAWWVKALLSLAALLALLVIGPFYVAAGFGLYLNRRSESEAWDLELAFRRLRERLLARMLPVLLATVALVAGAVPFASQAQSRDEAAAGQETTTLEQVFGKELADDAGFRRAVTGARQDPLLGEERTVVRWQPKANRQASAPGLFKFGQAIAGLVALVGEWILWVLLGIAVLAALLTAPRWLPWLRGSGRRRRAVAPAAPRVDDLELPETLPDNISAAARRLWRDGRQRAALALLYRGSAEAVALRSGQALPAGATEAQCLRLARALPPELQAVFAGMVRTWQYAAYAGRLPDEVAFEALLAGSARAWGWPA